MNITSNELLRGCIRSSIAHAIMVNCYPELSYEQSWDGNNFSAQDGGGCRGTITFLDDCCVGAIRNERGQQILGFDAIDKYICSFPDVIQTTAKAEALQYLLVNQNGAAIPSVTSLFWCDDARLYVCQECEKNFREDVSLFKTCFLPLETATKVLVDYYNMDIATYCLFRWLVEQKGDSLSKKIVLTAAHKNMFPGIGINDACVEALSELNIFT